jgi:hypothetical protein
VPKTAFPWRGKVAAFSKPKETKKDCPVWQPQHVPKVSRRFNRFARAHPAYSEHCLRDSEFVVGCSRLGEDGAHSWPGCPPHRRRSGGYCTSAAVTAAADVDRNNTASSSSGILRMSKAAPLQLQLADATTSATAIAAARWGTCL